MTEISLVNNLTLKAAIIACSPFDYLADLKKNVVEYLGLPELANEPRFGVRVYTLEREASAELREIRFAAMGFSRASYETALCQK